MCAEHNNSGAFALFLLITPKTISLMETIYWTKHVYFNFSTNFVRNPFRSDKYFASYSQCERSNAYWLSCKVFVIFVRL
jgi:hypothetical protein